MSVCVAAGEDVVAMMMMMMKQAQGNSKNEWKKQFVCINTLSLQNEYKTAKAAADTLKKELKEAASLKDMMKRGREEESGLVVVVVGFEIVCLEGRGQELIRSKRERSREPTALRTHRCSCLPHCTWSRIECPAPILLLLPPSSSLE
jgi:hypothetical protein